MSRQFRFAWWIAALFAVGFFGGALLTILGTLDFLQDLDSDPAGTVVRLAFISLTLVLLVVLPSGYYLVRHTRGIPMLTIDARGVILGGSWEDDLAVEWRNVSRVALRRSESNGIVDVQVIFTLTDDAALLRRVRNVRQRFTIWTNRMMFGAPFGISTAYVQGGSRGRARGGRRSLPGRAEARGVAVLGALTWRVRDTCGGCSPASRGRPAARGDVLDVDRRARHRGHLHGDGPLLEPVPPRLRARRDAWQVARVPPIVWYRGWHGEDDRLPA